MRVLLVFVLALGACADGTSVLSLSMTSNGSLDQIDHLDVTLTDSIRKRTAQPVHVTFADAPISLPPARTAALVLPADVRGSVHVSVEAFNGAATSLGVTSADVVVTPGKTVTASVTFAGAPSVDLSIVADMTVLPPDLSLVDLAMADLACKLCPTVCCPSTQMCGTSGCCTPGSVDLPDDGFLDTNCDGIDGDVSDAVFVDPIGGNDGNIGTPGKPLATLGAAFTVAGTNNKHQILVSKGNLVENSTLMIIAGISVYGGYDASQSWTRTAAIAHPLLNGASTAVQLGAHTRATTWERVDVVAASAGGNGVSSYGMFVLNGTSLTIRYSSIKGGNGSAGTAGTSPNKPATPSTANGGTGAGQTISTCCVAVNSDTCAPGTGGSLACGSVGGTGNPCGKGTAVPSAGGPKAGSKGGINSAGGPGGVGDPAAATAMPTVNVGTFDASGYHAPPGVVGADGNPGSGGGGGGYSGPGGCTCNTSVTFGPGSGGGAGGCPGLGGTVAGGGGGSFAVFLFNASPTLDHVTLSSGSGGTGGVGAKGAGGGDPGAPGGASTATAGGPGGAGSQGGPSSGGPGGPSVCVESAGSSTPIFSSAPTFNLGAAGNGGNGAAIGAPNGLVGVSANQRTN